MNEFRLGLIPAGPSKMWGDTAFDPWRVRPRSTPATNAELGPGTRDRPGLLSLVVLGGGGVGQGRLELVGRDGGIDIPGGDRAIGQDGDHIVAFGGSAFVFGL